MAEQRRGSGNLRARAGEVAARLARTYPGQARDLCALRFETPFQLLVATILSAQSTDVRVNLVTPELFHRYPDPASLAAAEPEALEAIIRSTGFFRAKTRNLIGMAAALVERFGGEVPTALEDLVTLPVDTHVGRLARRLGLSAASDPVKVEAEVSGLLAPEQLGAFSLRLILHGRAVCVARRPRCEQCVLADLCPSSAVPGGAGHE